MSVMVMPHASVDDIQAELDDTRRAISRMGDGLIVNQDQFAARLDRLNGWERKLQAQLEAMEAADVA